MKVFLCLMAVIAAAQAQTMFVEDGKEIVFDTESAASAGSMDYATHTSGFSYRFKTRVQVSGKTLNIKFENVKMTQYVGAHNAKAWPYDSTKWTDISADPPAFAVNLNSDGLFESLVVPSGASIFERNMMRGWASSLQINTGMIKQGKRGFRSKEKLINGECDVTYSVTPNAVLKTVSHVDDCEKRSYRLIDDYRTYRCDGEIKAKGPGYPSSLTTTVFKVEKNGDRFQIKAIVTSGTFIAQFYEEEGSSQAVYTNQTSFVTDRKSSSGDIRPSGGKTITDLSFEWSDGQYKWDQDRDLKAKEPFFATGEIFDDSAETLKQVVLKGINAQKTIIEKLDKTSANIQNAHKYGINSISPAFMALDYTGLKSIADQLYADKSDTGMMKSNIFGELLGSAGTTAAAMVVKDLLVEKKFDNARDAARILTAIPFHIRRPNTQLVKEFEPLLTQDHERFVQQTLPLMFGHLIKMTCTRAGRDGFGEKKRCFKEFASTYVKKMYSRISSSSDRKEKGLLIAALNNMKFGGQSKILKPLIRGEIDKDDHQLRSSALHAASWEAIVSGNGIAYFLPIFADNTMHHDMRISALELLLHSKPKAADIANVVAALYGEKDWEVVNYAYTLFQRWANSIDPCQRETGHLIKYFLKYMTQYSGYEPSFGFGVSKTYARQFYKRKYGYGGGYMFYVVGTEKSFAPISFGGTMTATMMGNMKSYIMGVHLRVEGLAKGLIRKFKKTDPTTWKTGDLEKILFSDMAIRERPDMPVRVQISITLKGNIVFHRYYDDDSAKPDGHIRKFMEQFKGLGETYNVNHQRAVQLGGFLYEQPTPLGVPLAIMDSTTSLQHFSATVKRGNHRGLLYRDISYNMHAFTQSMRGAMVRHPIRKASYGIMNDRIYHVHMPRKVVLGVNPIKRELKISVSRPEYTNPWKIFMHSQTVVLVRGNNVKGDYSSLQDNCPSCKNRVIISRGPDAIKDRVFINRENTKFGYRVNGEYFNCEMDISKKNTVGHLIGSFMPYNKNPRTPYNSIMMGIRQIRAFFYYFPKNEQCGAEIQYSQSQTNPTTEIEVSIRGSGEKNGERLFLRGRKIIAKALIKAKGTPADRSYRVNLAYEFTPGNVENRFKLQVNRAPVPALNIAPYSLCFALENKYPDFSEEFMGYDKQNHMKVTGKAMIQYGEGTTCDEGDGEIRVNFEHSTTQAAREELKNKWYYKQCEAQAKSSAWSGSKTLPVSEPCMMSVYDATLARKYSWDVEFVKVTDRLKRIASRAKALAEAGLIAYWDADPEDDSSSDEIGPFMNLDVEFKNEDTSADVKVETRKGTREYKDLALRRDWTRRLRNLKFTGTLRKLFYAKLINPCVVTSTDVRTSDNVTYSYSPSQCWTLTSAKCSPTPEYAVFTKRSTGLPLAAKIFIGGHEVEFSPAGNSVKLTINGAPINLNPSEETTHTVDGVEIFKIFRWGSSYHLYSFIKVWVVYDGHFVEVVPAPSALGQHCGTCGNYNRNQHDEFTGKDNTLVSTAAELVKSWEWKC